MSKKIIKKCAMCKQSIDIINSDEKLLFFDNKFYHKNCFLESRVIKKKCKFCGKDILYNESSKDEFVYYDDRFFHNKCFDSYCSATKTRSQKREFAKRHKNDYVLAAKEKLDNLFSKKNNGKTSIKFLEDQAKNEIIRITYESKVNQYIKDNYNISTVSGRIWKSLTSVYNGTHKKTEIPIPPDHLLDMWKRKQDYLNKQFQKTVVKKDLTNEGRVLYDIVILINKYNSYLDWLNNKKQDEADVMNRIDSNNSIYLTNKPYIRENKKSTSDNELENVLEDIFGES